MKIIFSFFLLLIMPQTSFAQTDSLTKIKIVKDLESLSLSNANDTANYIIGLLFSKQLETLPKIITVDEMAMLKGFMASQENKAIFTFKDANEMLMQIISPPPPVKAESAKEAVVIEEVETKPISPKAKMTPEEMVFFVKNGKREGVKTMPSGIQYELMLGSGRGGSPTLKDNIKFFYFAKYEKDAEVEEVQNEGSVNLSYQNEKWQEIYQLLKVGNTYRFYLPSTYSNRAPSVLANKDEMIIVDLELKTITPPYNYDDEDDY